MKLKIHGVKFKIKDIYIEKWGITAISVSCKQMVTPELTYYFGKPKKDSTKYFAEDFIYSLFEKNIVEVMS